MTHGLTLLWNFSQGSSGTLCLATFPALLPSFRDSTQGGGKIEVKSMDASEREGFCLKVSLQDPHKSLLRLSVATVG